MKTEINLRVLPENAANTSQLKEMLANQLKVSEGSIKGFRVIKQSIDARKHPVQLQLNIEVWVNTPMPPKQKIDFKYPNVTSGAKVLVVGAGMSGLFAALKLIELGLKPVVFERGKKIEERNNDLLFLDKSGTVHPDSNYLFGEGGSAAFSDGRLMGRLRGEFRTLLEKLIFYGADDSLLINSNPSINSLQFPKILQAIRSTIIRSGGEIYFESRVDDLLIEKDEVKGVITSNGDEVVGDAVLLAIGSSAYDFYHLLQKKSIALESKAFTVGVRVEHPQHLIDKIQYHTTSGRGDFLPPAIYNLSCKVQDRRVFSTSMSPAGVIIPVVTSAHEVAVSGRALSVEESEFASSAIVVDVNPSDIKDNAKDGVLAGLKFLQNIEQVCSINGGGGLVAPAQRLTDFINGRLSFDLPASSYLPGVLAVPLHFILPDVISTPLREGLKKLGKMARGFVTDEALVIGVESRNSSPIQIPRVSETFSHPQIKNLFPCGKSSGFSQGIASSALDGERCAVKIAQALGLYTE